ncbi:competence protein ComEA, partial [Pseudomonas aeruginosa]|nr:competence protein ComEA [Pseudomonas aeruginosa]
MHLIKSALLLILFACLPFSASAAPVAVAKNPLAATTADSTPSGHPVHSHLARHSTAIWPPV